MDFKDSVISGFQNWKNPDGRASRSEYWIWVATIMILNIVVSKLDKILFPAQPVYLSLVFLLIIILPSFMIAIRRLHDLNKSGWWLLIGLIPLIGTIVLIVWNCIKGTAGPNRYGPDPLADKALAI